MRDSLTPVSQSEPDIMHQMQLVMRNRKNCDSSCRFFSTCPVQPIAYLDPSRKCLMAMYGEPLQRTYVNLALRGEEGLLDEMRRTLFQFARKMATSDKNRDIREYFDLLARFHKILYGDKGLLSNDPQELEVNIRRIGRVTGPTQIADMSVELDDRVVSDAQLCDPDSLFYNEDYAKSKGFVVREDSGP